MRGAESRKSSRHKSTLYYLWYIFYETFTSCKFDVKFLNVKASVNQTARNFAVEQTTLIDIRLDTFRISTNLYIIRPPDQGHFINYNICQKMR